jgi:hypothetical protein
MDEKIIPIPKGSIRKPAPPTWQPDPAGGWEKGGIWVVPIDGGMWGVRWSVDDEYDGWTGPFGLFHSAEAAMRAVDDGYDPIGGALDYWEDQPPDPDQGDDAATPIVLWTYWEPDLDQGDDDP